jgi:2-oxoglutarate ferredoxin oxidoreductase subunit alpha
MIIVDVQRAGPSTGMPTKTEAADLLAAVYGRHGESPIPVVASYTPSQCFEAAIEAVRIAVKYRTPVILLSDTFLTNSSEPWLLPDLNGLPAMDPHFATQPNHDDGFMPYLRDDNLSRPWAIPGTRGLEHRVGGLEKEDVSGNISYDSANHERMTHLRAAKVQKIADDIPPLQVDDPGERAEVLVVGWGSTYGAIKSALQGVRRGGRAVAHVHLVHLNPLPNDLEGILRRYRAVVVPEMNTGQLAKILRSEYLVDAEVVPKVQGQPFAAQEIEEAIIRRV